ncbi:MAG TPA: nitroreductase family protein [Actinomycetota bacterium]|nr:nitroreductase family protein [Actinomycetota bacterium]
MEFSEVVRRRRMVRNYTDEPVSEDAIDRIAAAALRGPSAGYSQGVRLIVVTDEATRRRIAELADEPAYIANGLGPWISIAPVHLVVCVRADDYHERYNEPDKRRPGDPEMDWPVPYWWVDAGAALMLALLATVDEGLAAGLVGFHSVPELKTALGIPDDVSPIGVVTIGHPAPDRRSGSLARGPKPRAETVRREHW